MSADLDSGPAAGYGEDLAAIHSAGYTELARAAAAELLPRLPDRARVVELGCGDGTTAALLAEAGHRVHGIDLSPELVAIARRRAPAASFEVGSFVDAVLPRGIDAIVAVGEVLGYRLDARADRATLGRVIERAAAALRYGGLMLFDLAGPARRASEGRRWSDGEDWAVMVEVEVEVEADVLTRRIVGFRRLERDRFRRFEERHRLILHRPAEVLGRLRGGGFVAGTLPSGYAGGGLIPGVTAYLARRRGAGRRGGGGPRR